MEVQLKERVSLAAAATAEGDGLRDIVGQLAAISPDVTALLLLREGGVLQVAAAAGVAAAEVPQGPWAGEQFLSSPAPAVLTGKRLAEHPAGVLLPESEILFTLPLAAMDSPELLGLLLVGARAEGALAPGHLPLLNLAARQICLELDRRQARHTLAQVQAARRLVEEKLEAGTWACHVATAQIAFSDQAGRIFGQPAGKTTPISWKRLLPLIGAADRRTLWKKGREAFRDNAELDLCVQLQANHPAGKEVRIWGKPVLAHNELARFEGVVQRVVKPERTRVEATGLGYDLRGQIHALKELAATVVQEPAGDRQHQYLHLLHLSAQHLSRLFDFAVDPVSLSPRELTFSGRAFNLRELLHQIHNDLAINTTGKKLDFDLVVEQDIPEHIVGDPQWLEHILKTLVINSFLFTEKGYVKIIVDVLYQSDRELVLEFTVVDSGVGISDEGQLLLDRLPAGGQLGQSPLQPRVTGLELANRLVDLQGGALQVNSTPHEGTEFYFKLKFGKSSLGKLSKPHAAK